MEFNSKKVFVGNLPFKATKNDLETLFDQVHILDIIIYHACFLKIE